MNAFIKTVLVLSVTWQISGCSPSLPPAASTGTPSPTAAKTNQTETSLTLISYNLKGIPSIFASDTYTDNNTTRADAFAGYLKARIQQGTAPDAVLLQEVFDPRILTTLVSNSGYPYYYTDYPANYTFSKLFSTEAKAVPSGLLILSQHPIAESAYHSFPSEFCELDDCFARKGVLWVKIQKPGVPFPIDVFNTHMQASTAQEAIREKQINDMVQFVSPRLDKAKTVFFGGDFNFRISERYQTDDLFIRLFKQTDSFLNCLQTADCKTDLQAPRIKNEFDFLDHIFYRNNASDIELSVLKARASEEKYRLNGQLTHLSDHPMLETSYSLRWK